MYLLSVPVNERAAEPSKGCGCALLDLVCLRSFWTKQSCLSACRQKRTHGTKLGGGCSLLNWKRPQTEPSFEWLGALGTQVPTQLMLCRLPFLEGTELSSWPPNSHSFIFSIWRRGQFTKRTHLASSSRMRPFHPGRSVWWESSEAELTLVPQSHCSWGSRPLGHHHFVLYQAPWVQLIPVLTVENNTPEKL